MTTARLPLRIHRRSITGVALLLVVLSALQASGYAAAGDPPGERAAFAAQSEGLAHQLTFLAPAPTELETLGGYVTWRVFGALPLFLGLWAVWLAVSALRGCEEASRWLFFSRLRSSSVSHLEWWARWKVFRSSGDI
jgi:hypothetical protein